MSELELEVDGDDEYRKMLATTKRCEWGSELDLNKFAYIEDPFADKEWLPGFN